MWPMSINRLWYDNLGREIGIDFYAWTWETEHRNNLVFVNDFQCHNDLVFVDNLHCHNDLIFVNDFQCRNHLVFIDNFQCHNNLVFRWWFSIKMEWMSYYNIINMQISEWNAQI